MKSSPSKNYRSTGTMSDFMNGFLKRAFTLDEDDPYLYSAGSSPFDLKPEIHLLSTVEEAVDLYALSCSVARKGRSGSCACPALAGTPQGCGLQSLNHCEPERDERSGRDHLRPRS